MSQRASDAPRPPVLGLIGGMGSGKSAVAAALARRGAYVLSGDALGHEALRQPEFRAALVRQWGPQILDDTGAISRPRLAAIVFQDAAARRALEALVHPWIGCRLAEEVQRARQQAGVPCIVVDAALLLEAGWDRYCDYVVFVHAPRRLRLQRLAEQRGWSEAEVNARARAQLPLSRKIARADFVLDNSGSPAELDRQVDKLLDQLSAAALPAAHRSG